MMMGAPKRIEIARFPGNKRFAVTFSWDDGVIEDRRLVAFMNEHGLRGTFNLNAGTLKRAGTPSTEGGSMRARSLRFTPGTRWRFIP
jgi:hypothetical protein